MLRRTFLAALAALPIVAKLIAPRECACADSPPDVTIVEIQPGPPPGGCSELAGATHCEMRVLAGDVEIARPLCPIKCDGDELIVDCEEIEIISSKHCGMLTFEVVGFKRLPTPPLV